ncbi:recombinase family protein [Kiloniella antarctica]|uniref:Recombinase family protein n=1 Tax=Kiloniella antarctica TaxID=1550907 RepID=A0ABW5BLG6_9PROT
MKIGYARASGEGQNLAQQVTALEDAGCERVFSEILPSNRVVCPALEEVLALAGPEDSLVIWRLDRLGRRTVELIEFIQDLQARDINFQSLSEGINTATPLGKMVYTFITALAGNERDLVIERTLKGLETTKLQKSKKQKSAGRPRTLSREEISAAMTLLSSPDQEGKAPSLSQVADALNTNMATLSRRLKEISENESSQDN